MAIADHGTVAAAAAALSLTSPAVSQQIAKLERSVGTTLLERDRGRVWVNDHGRALVEASRHILDSLAEAERVARRTDPETSSIRLGLYASAMSLPAAGLLDRGVVTEIIEVEPHLGLEMLRTHELDLLFGHEPAIDAPQERSGVTVRGVSREALVLVGPAGTALSSNLADHAAAPWVLPGPDGPCRDLSDWAYRSAGFAPRSVGQCASFETMLHLVRAGMGLALIAEFALGPDRNGLEVQHLTAPVAERRLFLAARTSRASMLDAFVPRFQNAQMAAAVLAPLPAR